MENERTENIFYLDLIHVHKYGCAKFQPNPLFSSQQTATESPAEEKEQKKKKKKKVGKPIGDPGGGQDAPMSIGMYINRLLLILFSSNNCTQWYIKIEPRM